MNRFNIVLLLVVGLSGCETLEDLGLWGIDEQASEPPCQGRLVLPLPDIGYPFTIESIDLEITAVDCVVGQEIVSNERKIFCDDDRLLVTGPLPESGEKLVKFTDEFGREVSVDYLISVADEEDGCGGMIGKINEDTA